MTATSHPTTAPTAKHSAPPSGWHRRVTVGGWNIPVWVLAVSVTAVVIAATIIVAASRPAPQPDTILRGTSAAMYLSSDTPDTFTTLASTRTEQPTHPDALTRAMSTLFTDTGTTPPLPETLSVSTLQPPYAVAVYSSDDTGTPLLPVFTARGTLTEPLPQGWYTTHVDGYTLIAASQQALDMATQPDAPLLTDVMAPAVDAIPSGRNGLLWVNPAEATKVSPQIVPWIGRDTDAAATFLGPTATAPLAAAVSTTPTGAVTLTTAPTRSSDPSDDTTTWDTERLFPANTAMGYAVATNDTTSPVTDAWNALGLSDDERRSLTEGGYVWAVTVERDGPGVVTQTRTNTPVLASTIALQATRDTVTQLLPEPIRNSTTAATVSFVQQPVDDGLVITSRPDRLTGIGAGFTDRPDVTLPDLTGATSVSFTNTALLQEIARRTPTSTPVAEPPATSPPATTWVRYRDGHVTASYTPTDGDPAEFADRLTLPATWYDDPGSHQVSVDTPRNTPGPLLTITDLPEPVTFTNPTATRALLKTFADRIDSDWTQVRSTVDTDASEALNTTITDTITKLRARTPSEFGQPEWEANTHTQHQHAALNTLAQIQTVAAVPMYEAWADTARWQAVIDDPSSSDEQRDAAQVLVDHGPQASQWAMTWVSNITNGSPWEPFTVGHDITQFNTATSNYLPDVAAAYRIVEPS